MNRSLHASAWRSLKDSVAANIMLSGLELKFYKEPKLYWYPPKWAIPSKAKSLVLLQFLPDFMRFHTVRELFPPFPKLYYSIFFTVPKRDGSLRPIIDLSKLNLLSEGSIFQNGID